MSREITISPRLDSVQLATLSRQAASLDRLLDNPFSGPQPIAQTGVLEQVGGLLWNAAGLAVDELLAAIAQARVDKSPVRLVVTDAVRDLPAPTRVLLTGRYSFHRLPAHVQFIPVPDVPYGDVLLRMNRLRWPPTMDLEKNGRYTPCLAATTALSPGPRNC